MSPLIALMRLRVAGVARNFQRPAARFALVVAAATIALPRPPAAAQASAWRWSRPEPQGNTLRGACVDGEQQVWVAGDVGTLGRLHRDGKRLDLIAVESTDDLARVACCPGGVIAVGMRGRVVRRTSDGSVSEQALGAGDAGGPPTLNGVTCVGERGLAVSSARGLWVSSDAGGTFERRAAPHELYAVHAVGPAVVASGPRGVVARTTDLGRSWTTSPTPASTNLLAFAGDERDLMAVGARGAALRSTDGGVHWSPMAAGVEADLIAIARSRTGETLAVGSANAALALRPQGSATAVSPLAGRYHALVATANGFVAVGERGRIALRRGRSRFAVAPRIDATLLHMWSDGRVRIVVGDMGFVARADGSAPLRQVRVPAVVPIHAVTGNRHGVVLAVGDQGVILRSQDRGRQWQRVQTAATKIFHSVWLDDAGHAVAVGQKGQRYRSDDGGRHWTSVSLADTVHFSGLAARGSTLWVTAPGRLERSEDFGATWTAEPLPSPTADLHTPFVTSQGTLLATSHPGNVLRRDAQGRWSTTPLRPQIAFGDLAGDAQRLFLVASDGSIFVSTDDGRTWTAERPLTREVLSSVWAAPGQPAFVTGFWGTLLTRSR